MDEYTARLQSVVDYVRQLRSSSGVTSNTLVFGALSVMLSKKKINIEDLDVIFEVERTSAADTLRSLYIQNLGEKGFELQNEQDLANANDLLQKSVNEMKEYIVGAAKEIPDTNSTTQKSTSTSKRKRKKPLITTDSVISQMKREEENEN